MDEGVKKAAATLARLGGMARAAGMTAQERSASARAAVVARWQRASGPMRATHQGVLGVGDIPCYVLEDGRRVLSRSGMIQTLGMKHGGNPKIGSDRLTNFAKGKRIKPFIPGDLAALIEKPIQFLPPTGGTLMWGYEATTLVDLCESILKARDSGGLQAQQRHLAAQADLLLRGFARVGIIALVDEATGYQADRAKDALARILERFIAKELRKWVRTFPAEYYQQLFRLRGWSFTEKNIKAKPPLVGRLTNNIVYSRLAPGVLEELRRLTPRDEKGRHKHRFHQRLSEDVGHPRLREHLTGVIFLMKANTSWEGFLRQLDMAMPQYLKNYELNFEEDVA